MELYTIVFIAGLIFGSFLNVLIHRLPLSISLFNPVSSFCPHCSYSIKWYENIPIVSYLLLKGQCSSCSERISMTYPIVELLTAGVTLLIFQKQPSNYEFFLLLGIFYTLIVLSFIDFKYQSVPSYLLIIVVIFTLLVGDTMATLMFMGGFVLLELVTTFYIQTIKARITDNPELENQRALGEGDIPIAGVIGGLLGVQLGVTAIFVAAILALIPAIYNLFGKKEIQTPFIPFLSLGLLIVYISEFNLFGLFV